MTPEQTEQVKALRTSGVCVAETAAEIGASVVDVRNAFPATDAEVVSDYKTATFSVKAICARNAIMTAQLYAILTRTGTPRRTGSETVEKASELASARVAQLDDAVARYKNGDKISSIIFHTGVSQPTLHQELHRRGITTRRAALSNVKEIMRQAGAA